MEGGVMLAPTGRPGRKFRELARLAGYVFRRYPSHWCQDSGDFFWGTPRQLVVGEDFSGTEALIEYTADAVDLAEVIA
ncbi:MAG: hypothetical protein ACTHKL_15820 [Streptosporangiaceae bacterium]